MLTQITAMEVANASLYGGASALAEAVLMAVRCQQKNNGRKILMPKQCHPHYQAVTRNIVAQQNIRLQEYGYDKDSGQTDLQALKDCHCEGVAAIVIQQPNFFGIIEDVDAIVQWAEENNLLIIAVANPMFLSVLKPPGEWANSGVDIACGDVQPFGIPLTSGGPYCGYLCARKKHLRQMPGRIVGRTVDTQGREGYTLTLQAREQHIRRSKARSNICTNQGLLVVAATIYLSIMGPQGIRRVAEQCYQRTRELVTKLTAIDGVKKTFSGAYFGDCALQLPKDINHILDVLAEQGFAAGYALGQHYCDLDQSMLVAATETNLVIASQSSQQLN